MKISTKKYHFLRQVHILFCICCVSACAWPTNNINESKASNENIITHSSNPQINTAEQEKYNTQNFNVNLLLAVTQRQLGRPYRYGGNSPSGFDCSGLVEYSFKQLGIQLERRTIDQMNELRAIQFNDLRAGDLAFFQTGNKQYHVAIMLDEQNFIHAPSSGKTVSQSSFKNPYWKQTFLAARRY